MIKPNDKGTTFLYDSKRAKKNELIFDVMGELDELSSRIGMLCSLLSSYEEQVSILRRIQCVIQDIITDVKMDNKDARLVKNENVEEIEEAIDILEKTNPKITRSILHGVTMADSQVHICRTQTRKAERYLWKLHNSTGLITIFSNNTESVLPLSTIRIDINITTYLNRLSDFFSVLSKWICFYTQNV